MMYQVLIMLLSLMRRQPALKAAMTTMATILGKINCRPDVFVYDARTAVIDLNTHMRLPHPFNEDQYGD